MSICDKDKNNKKPDIGGQAVLEGVMMRSPTRTAIAVRKPGDEISLHCEGYESPSKKHAWMGLPIVRGAVSLVIMMKSGMAVLEKSATMSGAMDEEPSRFEKWLSKKLGKSADKVMMGVAMVLAVFLSVGLFLLLPNLPARALRQSGMSVMGVNLIAGLIRTLLLIGYLGLCGLIPDMRRTFQYHGAEHKTVYTYEHGRELTPENAATESRLHPRCGTSFLLITFIFSILFYSVFDQLVLLLGYDMSLNLPLRVVSRLVLLPLLAGISYEILKGLAHAESPLAKALRWPGMQLQRLTTREPDLKMLSVAIAAFKAAVDGVPEGLAKDDKGFYVLDAAGNPPAPAVDAAQ